MRDKPPMTALPLAAAAARNVALYPWFKFFQNLIFWQAVWFLYFQNTLSAAEAILLYAVYDVATTALEVPSGYMSDRLGRRFTLVIAAMAGLLAMVFLAFGGSFEVFVAGQVLLGASAAFASGTDSAMLYESLVAGGRKSEVEHQELRAWRFSTAALALSAVCGGALALWSAALPFWVSALAFAAVLYVTFRFTEPPHVETDIVQGAELIRLSSLRSALTEPVLIWLFVLSVVMYTFSHIPFVFGQPFILEALRHTGLAAEVPLVSGIVTATMMGMAIVTSLFAMRLRQWLGLAAVVLVAFALQILLIGVLALTNHPVAIAFLFLRMVPNALSRPFILARIQPLLQNDSRATYMSLQSLCGRLFFAATLYFASRATSAAGQMPHAEIQSVLGWYVLGGLACLGLLALLSRRVKIEP